MLVFHDKEAVACGTVGWRWGVGIEPSCGHRLRIDHRHALSFGKCPYQVVPVYVGFLHFCYGLVGVLHTDDIGLECAWIVHYESYVGSDNQLITSILQLVDASDACWHGNPGEMVLLVVDCHLAISRGEEDGVAHFSEPLEGRRGMEVLAVDECSLVGENPFTASLVLLDKPYVAASQSFFAHLDELGLHALYVLSLTYTNQEVLFVSRNPGVSIGEWIYLARLQMDAETLAEHRANLDKLALLCIEDV